VSDLIKVTKASDFLSAIFFLITLLLVEHYIDLKASDYISLSAIFVLLYLHVLSMRSNNERFAKIEAQENEANKRYIHDQRMRVLEKIGTCNTLANFNNFRLKQLLDTYSHKMDAEQISNLNKLSPEMNQQVVMLDELSNIYATLTNEVSLEQINQDYARLVNADSDGQSILKMIEAGFKSYEEDKE